MQGQVNRHLQLAVGHVNEAWFPINPVTLSRISENLNTLVANRSQLIKEVKRDVALYLYAVKRLGGQGKLDPLHPLRFLNDASADELRAFFDIDPSKVSSHRLPEMTREQAGRMQQAIVASSVTQVLSEPSGVDAELGYTASLLRQLGATLIAWNYPHVFKRVAAKTNTAQELDLSITRMLGFSPTMLTIALTREWQLPTELRYAAGDASVVKGGTAEDARVEAIGSTLVKICKIGEVFAGLNNGGEQAASAWDAAKVEIETLLGKDGLKRVSDMVRQNALDYAEMIPDLLPSGSAEDQLALPPSPTQLARRDTLLNRNAYIRHCPVHTQQQLKEIYNSISSNTISRDVIERLSKQIIPEAGFYRGCVYLVEPESLNLMPRLAIGLARLSEFKTIRYTNSAAAEYDPVLAAYRCKTPIMETNVPLGDRLGAYVVGVLGDTQRAGVLYLELGNDLLENAEGNPLTYFKALRMALADCLTLN